VDSPSVLESVVIKGETELVRLLRSITCQLSLELRLFLCSSNFALLSLDLLASYIGKNGIEKLLPETTPVKSN